MDLVNSLIIIIKSTAFNPSSKRFNVTFFVTCEDTSESFYAHSCIIKDNMQLASAIIDSAWYDIENEVHTWLRHLSLAKRVNALKGTVYKRPLVCESTSGPWNWPCLGKKV
jgi:hypothetical protein